MIRFLIIYCAIYGVMHFYAYHTVKRGLTISKATKAIFIPSILAMIGGPIMVRIAEKAGLEVGSRIIASISFTWMGLLFLFVSVALLLDFLRCGCFWLRKVNHRWMVQSPLSARNQVIGLLAVTLSLYLYGVFEAANIQTKYLTIYSPKIPAHIGKIRVVQISDVHLGLLTKERKLEKILIKVRAAKPDILVSTGDLVDGQPNNITAASKLLAKVQAPLGKFAVLGNHEKYAGLENSIRITEGAGFKVLRNMGVVLDGLTIIGVDDKALRSTSVVSTDHEKKVLSSYNSDSFKLFLKHRPEKGVSGPNLFDLQLSGHTHKGQIFPFNLITWFQFPYPAGELIPLNGSQLYISPGSGTWGPPIRIMAPPEVTVIDLVHKVL